MLLRLLGVALGVLFGTSSVSAAAATTPVALGQLTWTEIRDAVHHGKTTVIIPAGGTEQSGPYIAVGKHNARVAMVGERIARALGNALVAPVIAYVPEGSIDPPTEHMRFPGTISVPADVFERTVESAAESLRAHGFTDIVLIGDHGGYQSNLQSVADRLNRRWAGRARAHYIAEYYRAVASSGGHADLDDTALTLATDPGLVRAERLRAAARPGEADGVYGGDPRAATAELGRRRIDAQVARSVQAIRRAIAQPKRR